MAADTADIRPDDTREQIVVLLGNPAPQMQTPGGSVPAEHIDQSVTRVEFWPGIDDPDWVDHTLSTDNDRVLHMISRVLPKGAVRFSVLISELEQIVGAHMGTASPDWVSCNDKDVEAVIAKHFNATRGEPTALFTNAGRDALHAQHLGTSAQPAAFNYIGLANSATATTPLATDTVLTGEITTAGGGLIRKQATYAHTTGTNTTTLTTTFTANGSDSLPVAASQIGVFNALTVGTMAFKTALSANGTFSASGDNLTITETVTAG